MSPVTLNGAAGERPREGGEVDSSFCSNFARKEATPLGEIPADMKFLYWVSVSAFVMQICSDLFDRSECIELEQMSKV